MVDAAQIAELLRRGIAAARARREEEAREILTRVTDLDERNEQAWLWLSGVVASLEERRVCLENALSINPANFYAQAGLRWVNQQISPPSALEECCPRCRSAIPPTARACPQCGLPLVVACPVCRQYVEVERATCPGCGWMLGDSRGGARYWLALARAYHAQGHHDLVGEAVVQAGREAPDDLGVLEGIAALYEEMGQPELAIAVHRRAIAHHPDAAAPYARLGAIYWRRAMAAEARAMIEKAVARAGDDAKLVFGLAELLLEINPETAPVEMLEKVVRLRPDHAQAYLRLGDAYLAQGKREKGIHAYERAVEQSTPDTMVGREGRRKLLELRPVAPPGSQGWGETFRLAGGLMLAPLLAVLVNARLIVWQIDLQAWFALLLAAVGSFLWVCAADTPRNQVMRLLFGQAGGKERWQKAVVGLPGVALWAAALGVILGKVGG